MRLVLEGTEEVLTTIEKIAKLAAELSDEAYKLRFINNCRFCVTEETDPAAATTEPEKND